jgi:hypothetical protein
MCPFNRNGGGEVGFKLFLILEQHLVNAQENLCIYVHTNKCNKIIFIVSDHSIFR